ncbi:hypothetical protein HD806DRAFT_542729 [Xylariaceae sp. AK1471]|nr:hypothetical protein HD806DRAFT_542729 [Xylariaceae sp. AK1471]
MPPAHRRTVVKLWDSFLGLGPLWLVLYLGFSIYSNDYRFAWTLLVLSGPTVGYDYTVRANTPLGLFLLIVSAILKFYWVTSWVQCLVITWLCDRKWVPKKGFKNSIRQVDGHIFPDLSFSGSIRFEEGRHLRKCPHGCKHDLTDRVYHCSKFGRCLPLYHQYCPWLWVTIYLRTIKPYWYTILFLTLDGIFTLVTSITALNWSHQPAVAPFVAAVLLAGVVIALVAADTVHVQFDRLLRRNVVAAEDVIPGKLVHLAFKFKSPGPRGEWYLRPRHFIDPWNLGFAANWRQVFGQHWYQWLVPFWAPERVSRYGKHGGLGDFPWSHAVRDFQAELLSVPLAGVTVDDPGSASTHVAGPSHRGQGRSDASRRSQQRSSGASTNQLAALSWSDLQRFRRRPEQGSDQ